MEDERDDKPASPPAPGPAGPRTPYPADEPRIDDLPGSEPDSIPGRPAGPGFKM